MKCHQRLGMMSCKVNKNLRGDKGTGRKVHREIMNRRAVTSLPESIVSLSLLPSSEPEATMALSMSPVARWQTQYFSASRGACRGEKVFFNMELLFITTKHQLKEIFGC